jgi:hypothetical protein
MYRPFIVESSIYWGDRQMYLPAVSDSHSWEHGPVGGATAQRSGRLALPLQGTADNEIRTPNRERDTSMKFILGHISRDGHKRVAVEIKLEFVDIIWQTCLAVWDDSPLLQYPELRNHLPWMSEG